MRKVQDDTIYLDSASTTCVSDEIIQDVNKLLEEYYGNADSIHALGQRVSSLVDASREQIAKYLGVLPHEVLFTSGGTESNVSAIKGIAFSDMSKKHIITSNIEHSSVDETLTQLEEVFGYEIERLPVNSAGIVEVEKLKKALRDDTILVSIMAVNNEIGSVFPISEYAQTIKKYSDAYFHVDGVQAFIKEDISLKQVDAFSISAHKINGLKGSGVLVKKSNVPFVPLMSGGQQESGLRGGTLNTIAAIVFAKTIRLAKTNHQNNYEKIKKMQARLISAFKDNPRIKINSPKNGTPYIFNMSIKGIKSEIMMNALSRHSIYVSARSTCHSQSNDPSHVLKAIGCSDEEALNSIRVSLHDGLKMCEIEKFIEIVQETMENVYI